MLLARALKVRQPVVVHPQFTEPEAALRDAGHAVDRVLFGESDRLSACTWRTEDADLVVIGNPTNPTSVLHPAASIAALARPGRTLVVDEAFMDAVPGEREALAGRTDIPGLVVLRSLTKTWAGGVADRIRLLLRPTRSANSSRAQPLWPVSHARPRGGRGRRGRPGARRVRDAARKVADRAHLVAVSEFEPDGCGSSSCPGSVRADSAAGRWRCWSVAGWGSRRGVGTRFGLGDDGFALPNQGLGHRQWIPPGVGSAVVVAAARGRCGNGPSRPRP